MNTIDNFNFISESIKRILGFFSSSDLNVMSDEARQILSNPKDAIIYKKGLKEMEEGKKDEIEITLSDKSKLTLVS